MNLLPEIVGENGIVLQRLEAEELDKALCKLFSHSQQTSFNVGIEARQYIVQKYSLAHRKQAMLSVLVST